MYQSYHFIGDASWSCFRIDLPLPRGYNILARHPQVKTQVRK